MATSTIQRPYVTSVLTTDYYRNHIINNAISIDSDGSITTRVVNGICYIRISGVTINQTGSDIQILDGLPLGRMSTNAYMIRGQNADKTLKYLRIFKTGSSSTDEDGLYLNTYNMSVGDHIGDVSLSYPIK